MIFLKSIVRLIPISQNAFQSNIGLWGEEFCQAQSGLVWHFFFGTARGGTLAPNKGETSCGGFVLLVRLNSPAPTDTLAKIGKIMNILFASCLTINPQIAILLKKNWKDNLTLVSDLVTILLTFF